jgi:flavodoxin
VPEVFSAYDCPKEIRVKAIIVYDSVHGNTEKIAQAIRDALPAGAAAMRPAEARTAEVSGIDLLIVGSPTLGGRPTEGITRFLGGLVPSALTGVKVAAFDTRVSMKFAKIFGYASDKILAKLTAAGGTQASSAHGFLVKGREGPLAEKEAERAAAWAKTLAGPR